MKMMKRSGERGFTLIELMIVVAIIGILAAIAIPKFADLIRKSNEGSTKGNLGALKGALAVYYGQNEGSYPNDDLTSLDAFYMTCAGVCTVSVVVAVVYLVQTLKQLRQTAGQVQQTAEQAQRTAQAVEQLARRLDDNVEAVSGVTEKVREFTDGLQSG